MKIKILSRTEDTLRFLLEGEDVALANALRRTMIMEVPCMTIDDLFIFDNSSPLPDENLAHRIGLTPLITDLDSYVLPEDCECGSDLGCSLCRVVLTLDVEAEDGNRTITSGDFVSEDPKVVPINPDIPLTKITTGQAVRLEAYARLGRGKTHAKWQPVSMAVYQHVGEVEVDEKRCTACAECVKDCPGGVLSIQDGKLEVVDIYKCTLCGDCVKACPVGPAAIEQGMKEDTFLFTVESTGCLPPERIVSEASKILIAKLDEFMGKLERGETDEEIPDFEITVQKGRGLYSIGTGEVEKVEEKVPGTEVAVKEDPDEDKEEEQEEVPGTEVAVTEDPDEDKKEEQEE